MSGTPDPKRVQVGRGAKYRRKIASPKRWQSIIDAKGGPCRACGDAGAVQYHHVVPRGAPWFGSDTEANIVPLCEECHGVVTRRSHTLTALRLVMRLSDAEYSYAVETCGETFFERAYGIKFERVS